MILLLVILFVRMWVEIINLRICSSSDFVILFVRMWVEISMLPIGRAAPPRHPLREDVSWNACSNNCVLPTFGHPLREDVSWNIKGVINKIKGFVILFVRMWVEMLEQILHSDKVEKVILFVRMWVEMFPDGAGKSCMIVILFVRMWVEISARKINGARYNVILFVRMWVEICSYSIHAWNLSSSSSWGCELK